MKSSLSQKGITSVDKIEIMSKIDADSSNSDETFSNILEFLLSLLIRSNSNAAEPVSTGCTAWRGRHAFHSVWSVDGQQRWHGRSSRSYHSLPHPAAAAAVHATETEHCLTAGNSIILSHFYRKQQKNFHVISNGDFSQWEAYSIVQRFSHDSIRPDNFLIKSVSDFFFLKIFSRANLECRVILWNVPRTCECSGCQWGIRIGAENVNWIVVLLLVCLGHLVAWYPLLCTQIFTFHLKCRMCKLLMTWTLLFYFMNWDSIPFYSLLIYYTCTYITL